MLKIKFVNIHHRNKHYSLKHIIISIVVININMEIEIISLGIFGCPKGENALHFGLFLRVDDFIL